MQTIKAMRKLALGAVVAAAAGAASLGAAQAAPITFTWNPGTLGYPGTGGAFTANNITVQDYAAVSVDNAGNFTENGLLNLSSFSLNGTPVQVKGLDSAYTLYVSFTATGTQSSGGVLPPPGTSVSGTFNTLSYTIYAAKGTPTFTADAAGGHVSGLSNLITLANGSLISGTTTLANTPGAGLSAGANVLTTFNAVDQAFFVAPPATVSLDFFVSVTNTGSVLTTPNPNTLVINGGGGNATLQTTPAPEPASLVLLGSGIAALGMIGRKRRKAA